MTRWSVETGPGSVVLHKTPLVGAIGGFYLSGSINSTTASRLTQFVDLCPTWTPTIDQGIQTFSFQAFIGGVGSNIGSFTVSASFFALDVKLGELVLGPVTRDDRGNTTKLQPLTISAATVPPGSRYALIRIESALHDANSREPEARLNTGLVDSIAMLFDNVTIDLDPTVGWNSTLGALASETVTGGNFVDSQTGEERVVTVDSFLMSTVRQNLLLPDTQQYVRNDEEELLANGTMAGWALPLYAGRVRPMEYPRWMEQRMIDPVDYPARPSIRNSSFRFGTEMGKWHFGCDGEGKHNLCSASQLVNFRRQHLWEAIADTGLQRMKLSAWFGIVGGGASDHGVIVVDLLGENLKYMKTITMRLPRNNSCQTNEALELSVPATADIPLPRGTRFANVTIRILSSNMSVSGAFLDSLHLTTTPPSNRNLLDDPQGLDHSATHRWISIGAPFQHYSRHLPGVLSPGWTGRNATRIFQVVQLCDYAEFIDSGRLSVMFRARMGGLGDSLDTSHVALRLFDGAHNEVFSYTANSDSAAERDYKTALSDKSSKALPIPALVRSAHVEITFTTNGANLGYSSTYVTDVILEPVWHTDDGVTLPPRNVIIPASTVSMSTWEMGVNWLRNGDAEDGTTTGWVGNLTAVSYRVGAHPLSDATSGQFYFALPRVWNASKLWSLEQLVSLPYPAHHQIDGGSHYAHVAASIGGLDDSFDEGYLALQFLDVGGYIFDSMRVGSSSSCQRHSQSKMMHIRRRVNLPTRTRHVNVVLLVIRRETGSLATAVFFDNVHFSPDPVPRTESLSQSQRTVSATTTLQRTDSSSKTLTNPTRTHQSGTSSMSPTTSLATATMSPFLTASYSLSTSSTQSNSATVSSNGGTRSRTSTVTEVTVSRTAESMSRSASREASNSKIVSITSTLTTSPTVNGATPSPTPSPSQSYLLPTLPPLSTGSGSYCHPQHPGMDDITRIPISFEANPNESILTAEFDAPFAAGWHLDPRPVVDRERFDVAVLAHAEGLPNVDGFIAHSYALVNATLRRTTPTQFFFTLPSIPAVLLDVTETLEIRLRPTQFLQCPPSSALPIGRLEIVATQPPYALKAAAALRYVGAATMIAAVAASGSALNVQQLASLAMSSCAPPRTHALLENDFLLAPLRIGSGYSGMIIGSWVLLASVTVCGLMLTKILQIYQRCKGTERSFLLWTSWLRLDVLLFRLLCILFPGIALTAAKMAKISSGVDLGFSLASLVVCAPVPILTVFVVWRYVSADFWEYDVGSLKSCLPVVRWFLPEGVWLPVGEQGLLLLGMFSEYRLSHALCVSMPFWTPTMFAVAAITPSSHCEVQLGVLLLGEIAFAFLIALVRPFRQPLANATTAGASTGVGIVLVGSLVSLQTANSTAGTHLIVIGTWTLIGTTVVNTSVDLGMILAERLVDSSSRVPTAIFRMSSKDRHREEKRLEDNRRQEVQLKLEEGRRTESLGALDENLSATAIHDDVVPISHIDLVGEDSAGTPEWDDPFADSTTFAEAAFVAPWHADDNGEENPSLLITMSSLADSLRGDVELDEVELAGAQEPETSREAVDVEKALADLLEGLPAPHTRTADRQPGASHVAFMSPLQPLSHRRMMPTPMSSRAFGGGDPDLQLARAVRAHGRLLLPPTPAHSTIGRNPMDFATFTSANAILMEDSSDEDQDL